MMVATFATLLCAHFIGDFVLQQDWMIKRKRQPAILLLHVAIITALSALLLGAFHPPILFAISITHAAADYIKTRLTKNDFWPFLFDQTFHLLIIGALAYIYPNAYAQGAWAILSPEASTAYLQLVTVIGGLAASAFAGSVAIAKLMEPISKEMNDASTKAPEGLANGGKHIGQLERSLIFLLVITGNPDGVGFLIGAKSILRIGELKDGHDRKLTEYVIIGTMLSFGWGLAIAELTRLTLAHFGLAQ